MPEKAKQLDDLMPLIRERLADGQSVTFSPRGTSMLPMLRQGRDGVVLSPLPDKLKKYDLPLYQRQNGQYVLHRIIKAGETYTCIGDNQFEYEYGLRHDQMIAVVTAFTRDGRRIEVTAPGYRVYCRFWVAVRPVRHLWKRGIGLLKRMVRRCLKCQTKHP